MLAPELGEAGGIFIRELKIVKLPANRLYCTLIPKLPYGVNVSEAFTNAYNKLKNKARLQEALNDATLLTDDAGKHIVDENGNYLAEVIVDGEKIPVIIGEEEALKKIDDAATELGESGSFLSKTGKFIDNTLEADYQKYLARKAKQGKAPRERLDWKEARDYWLFDSPMARGNFFNRKAWDESWYPAWEVQLDNGKFMDGYNPFNKEIISRKATSLEEISEETYIKYLNELKVKYAPPRKITSKKQGEIYDMIRNTNLSKDTKLILEIPESNRSFADIDKYIKIANEKGITLRFRPE